MRNAVIVLSALVLVPSALAAQADIQRGTIAVIPFGAASPEMSETAAAIGVAVENALQESGRFMAVLPRAGDAALVAEIGKTTEPTNLNSLIQITQDAQLNANYVLAGWVIGQDVKATRDANGNNAHTAEVRALVRILDVSSGAMVMSDQVTIHSGQTRDLCADGLRGAPCQALNLTKQNWPFATPDEALASARTNGNAQLEVQKSLTEKLGYLLLDMIEGDDGLQVIVRAYDGDPRRGTDLKVVQSQTSMTGATYTRTIGMLEVVEIDGEIAIANVKENGDRIKEALLGGQALLVLKN